MHRLRPLLAGLLLAGLGLPSPVRAQEREAILSYDVTLALADGGRMDVTEAITVRALGQEIRRGIYRDFPTEFPGSAGFARTRAPFEVLSVTRDGAAEPYRLEKIRGAGGRGGVRVRIGDPDVTLTPGVHRYVIRYETWRWVSFSDTGHELYWNATGNGWAFPIEHASVLVSLPGAPDPAGVRLEAWTGPEGSTASDARTSWDAARGIATVETTRPLAPREGLTFRLRFPAGVVAPPTRAQEVAWLRRDWGSAVAAGLLVTLVLGLYVLMWERVGRDPEAGPLVVRYEPPPGFSPAALGYLQRRGYDPAVLAAALVSLAVQGAVRIEKEGHTWTLVRTGVPGEKATREERLLFHDLLGGGDRLDLTPVHATLLRAAVKDLRQALALQLERAYFVLNRGWFGVGLAVSALGYALLLWRNARDLPPEAWFMGLWLTFWSLGVASLLVRAWRAWGAALRGGGVGDWIGALFLSAFATPFVAAELFVAGFLASRVPLPLVAAAVALGVVNAAFYHLLERPTLKGRGVLGQLEGFRAYLAATDGDRLDRMTPTERTPELFERWLPHAIALGVANRWGERFQEVLVPREAAATATAATMTGLAWYSADGAADFASVASSLGGAFSGSLSAASSPPSSGGSGGGGGGGSSGGGGGGGGGGGW